MALKPLPALPKIPKAAPLGFSSTGGAYDPNTSSYIPHATPLQPGGPGTMAFSPSGGGYDPVRGTFVPGVSSPYSAVPLSTSTIGPTSDNSSGDSSNSAAPPSAFDPNGYLNELQKDPMYISAMQAFNNAISGGQQSLAEQIKQQVIRSGYDPTGQMPASLAAQWGGAIDPATQAAAAANPMSTRAQLQLQLQQGQSDLAYNLAARGLERSGGFATGNTGLQNQYDTQSYGAMQGLLDQINQGSQNYAQFASNQLGARNAAFESVAQRLAMLQYGANYKTTPDTPPPDPSNITPVQPNALPLSPTNPQPGGSGTRSYDFTPAGTPSGYYDPIRGRYIVTGR